MNAEQCSQCGTAYQSRDIVPILPSTEADKAQVLERIETLRSQGLTHSLKKAPGSKKRKANGEVKAENGEGTAKMEEKLQVKDDKALNGSVNRSATTQSGTFMPKPSNGIKNAATASLTARVLEEEGTKKKRRLENENISSLYSKSNAPSKEHRGADFMTRGYSMAANGK